MSKIGRCRKNNIRKHFFLFSTTHTLVAAWIFINWKLKYKNIFGYALFHVEIRHSHFLLHTIICHQHPSVTRQTIVNTEMVTDDR